MRNLSHTYFLLICLLIISLLANAENNIPMIQQNIGNDLIKKDQYGLQKDLQNLLSYVGEVYSTHSSEYAESVLWTAMIMEQAGDNKQSQRLLSLSDKLFKKYGSGKFNGRDTIHEIFRLDLVSALEDRGGRDYCSLQKSKKSLKLKRQFFGDESEEYLNAVLDLSKLYAQRLNYNKSTQLHNEAFISYVNLLKNKFCSLSDFGREDFWTTAIKYINKTLELADKNGRKSHMRANQELSSSAYNALLLSKGILLNTSIGFERFVESTGDKRANELLDLKRKAFLANASRAYIDSLDYYILDALALNAISYEIPSLNIKWQDVQHNLNEKDLAIEFYRTSSDSYGAVLLKKDWKSPLLISLPNTIAYEGKVFSMSSILALYNQYIQENNIGTLSNLLTKSIWTDDIIQYFPSVSEGVIYFSADGQLQLTGIEYLPISINGLNIPIGNAYKIYRLSSTRYLVNNTPNRLGLNNAALFGGLQYDMTEKSLSKEHNKYPSGNRSIFSFIPQRRKATALEIDSLHKTLEEVQNIAAILNANSISSHLYKGHEGVEEAVKALSGKSPHIIHIATHGFYIPNEDMSRDYNRYSWLTLNDSIYDDNPLKRTGLLMAGAHKAYILEDPVPNVDDGILSAYEISQLNLEKTNLVVLSACETGLGDLTSDGVAGLQRGLKKAGTNSIFMSLWKVDDEATYQLMVNFYRHWIYEGKNKVEALYAAQRDIRNDAQHPEWTKPKYWAAFILLDGLD